MQRMVSVEEIYALLLIPRKCLRPRQPFVVAPGIRHSDQPCVKVDFIPEPCGLCHVGCRVLRGPLKRHIEGRGQAG